jgi:hypothetical protein
MNIVFIIARTTYYRVLGPFIDEAIDKSYCVEIWHDLTHPNGGMKGSEHPYAERSPFKESSAVSFKEIVSLAHYSTLIRQSSAVDYFVSIHPVFFPLSDEVLEKISGRWCIVENGWDTYWDIRHWQTSRDCTLLENYERKYFGYTDYWHKTGIEWLKKYQTPNGQNNYRYLTDDLTDVHLIGHANVSDSKLQDLQPAKIKKKYGIPKNKQILIYVPFPFYPDRNSDSRHATRQLVYSGLFMKSADLLYHSRHGTLIRSVLGCLKKVAYLVRGLIDSESRSWLMNAQNELQVIRRIREFCDQNNLYFVIKARNKFPVVKEAYLLGDLVVGDDYEQAYPSKMLELFSVARLGVGYYSMSVIESVVSDVPYINLESGHLLFKDRAHKELFKAETESLFSFDGVVWNYDIKTFLEEFADKLCENFKVDSAKSEKYKKVYIGGAGSSVARNLYRILESAT